MYKLSKSKRQSSSNRIPTIYLLDRSAGMVAAWQDVFEGESDITAVQDDFTHFMDKHPEIDCIVSPANSYGIMDGGYDRVITDFLFPRRELFPRT